VARYLDEVAFDDDGAPERGPPPPDFLSHSHGEGFLRFFEERCQRQGIFIFDEPESALSPSRQIAFLKLMRRMEDIGHCQIIMATHSPMLMAYPNATLLRLTKSLPLRSWALQRLCFGSNVAPVSTSLSNPSMARSQPTPAAPGPYSFQKSSGSWAVRTSTRAGTTDLRRIMHPAMKHVASWL
jgi:hypothetical protein